MVIGLWLKKTINEYLSLIINEFYPGKIKENQYSLSVDGQLLFIHDIIKLLAFVFGQRILIQIAIACYQQICQSSKGLLNKASGKNKKSLPIIILISVDIKLINITIEQ